MSANRKAREEIYSPCETQKFVSRVTRKKWRTRLADGKRIRCATADTRKWSATPATAIRSKREFNSEGIARSTRQKVSSRRKKRKEKRGRNVRTRASEPERKRERKRAQSRKIGRRERREKYEKRPLKEKQDTNAPRQFAYSRKM